MKADPSLVEIEGALVVSYNWLFNRYKKVIPNKTIAQSINNKLRIFSIIKIISIVVFCAFVNYSILHHRNNDLELFLYAIIFYFIMVISKKIMIKRLTRNVESSEEIETLFSIYKANVDNDVVNIKHLFLYAFIGVLGYLLLTVKGMMLFSYFAIFLSLSYFTIYVVAKAKTSNKMKEIDQ